MKRFFRLSLFAIASMVMILIILNFGLAWLMVSAMTHPFCTPLTEIAGFPDYQEHWLDTEDGITIRIWYYPSKNGAGIIAFGGMSGALGERLPPAETLIQSGYGVVQVDSRACAQPSRPVTQGYDELWDGQAALYFLKSQPEIDPERIGVMGFSMGGATALRVAAHHPEIQAIIRDGGFANLGDLLSPQNASTFPERIFQSTILFFYKIRSGIDPWKVNSIADLDQIEPRPVLLIYGENEAAAGKEQYASGYENVSLWIVPDGHHGRNHIIASEEYHRRVIDFFDQTLLEE